MFVTALAAFGPAPGLLAQESSQAEVREEVALLRQLQEQQRAAIHSTEERLARLEARLAMPNERNAAPVDTVDEPQVRPPEIVSVERQPPSVPVLPTNIGLGDGRLNISGDLRVRYEHNFGETNTRDRGRKALRARIRAAYPITSQLLVGGQIVTGDADDPNSTDTTLSGFDDDFDVSLDQAYLLYQTGNATVWAGKFPNPMVTTDVLWDADVSPQGLAGKLQHELSDNITASMVGLYFSVDEQPAGADSDLIAAQVEVAIKLTNDWSVRLAGSYLDYALGSTAGADQGDFRGNCLTIDGDYLSDFDLLDGLATIRYTGLGENWPVNITVHAVCNLGAFGKD